MGLLGPQSWIWQRLWKAPSITHLPLRGPDLSPPETSAQQGPALPRRITAWAGTLLSRYVI